MESPFKRRRLQKYGDSDLDLQTQRAKQEHQLKSRFESIFEKYEKDFTGIGDEIDFETGNVVVDNGHIRGMKYDNDVGDGVGDRLVDFADSESESTEDVSPDDSIQESDAESASVVLGKSHGDFKPSMAAFEELDDFDELGDPPDPIHAGKAKNAYKVEQDQDELAVNEFDEMGSYPNLQVPRRGFKDERGKVIDPKWFAPPLPHGTSEHRPAHRRLTMPLPLRPKSYKIDLGDWRQKGSIWDPRDHARTPPDHGESQHSGQTSEGQAIKDHAVVSENAPHDTWTETEERLLRYFKMSTAMGTAELVKYFPGKCTSSLAARWEHIECEAQGQDDLPHQDEVPSLSNELDCFIERVVDRAQTGDLLSQTIQSEQFTTGGGNGLDRWQLKQDFRWVLPKEIPDSDTNVPTSSPSIGQRVSFLPTTNEPNSSFHTIHPDFANEQAASQRIHHVTAPPAAPILEFSPHAYVSQGDDPEHNIQTLRPSVHTDLDVRHDLSKERDPLDAESSDQSVSDELIPIEWEKVKPSEVIYISSDSEEDTRQLSLLNGKKTRPKINPNSASRTSIGLDLQRQQISVVIPMKRYAVGQGIPSTGNGMVPDMQSDLESSDDDWKVRDSSEEAEQSDSSGEPQHRAIETAEPASREIPDSQSSQNAEREPHSPIEDTLLVADMASVVAHQYQVSEQRKLDESSKKVAPARFSINESPGGACTMPRTPKSSRRFRSEERSINMPVPDVESTKPKTFSRLILPRAYDEGDDDLSVALPMISSVGRIKLPKMESKTHHHVPPELVNCSDDELG